MYYETHIQPLIYCAAGKELRESAKRWKEILKERARKERRKAKKKSPLFRVSKVSGLPDVVFRWTGKAPESRHRALTIYEGRRRMFKGHKWERHLEKRAPVLPSGWSSLGCYTCAFH